MKNQTQIDDLASSLDKIIADLEYMAVDVYDISAQYGPLSQMIIQAVQILDAARDLL